MPGIRQVLAALLLLALTLGQPLPAAYAGSMPTDATGSDAGMPMMPGDCGGPCAGHAGDLGATTCAGTMCVGSAAILGSPMPRVMGGAAAMPSPAPEATAVPRTWPPDPHPPKPSLPA